MQTFYTGVAPPSTHMEWDRKTLEAYTPHSAPMIHHYDWLGLAATYGHFIAPEHHLVPEAASRLGLQLAQRSTGGGIIFHIADLSFSVLIPATHPRFSLNTLENYACINSAVARALCAFDPSLKPALLQTNSPEPRGQFCMAQPTRYDILIGNKKICGAAQRRTRAGLLHQGSLCLGLPSRDLLEQLLLPGSALVDAIFALSYPLLGNRWSEAELNATRSALRQLIDQEIRRSLT